MSRNILVCGLLLAGMAFAGCSSPSKSVPVGDGSVAKNDLAGETAGGDVLGGGGTGGDAGTLVGDGEATTRNDGNTRADGGLGGDAKTGQPGDLAGGAGGTGGGDGGSGDARDARGATDQSQPQNVTDGAPAVADGLSGQDAAQATDGVTALDARATPDGPKDSSRQDGPKDTGYCNLPDYGLSMPADQNVIEEKYGLCQEDGTPYTDTYGERLLFGRVLKLRQVERCVDSANPQKGKTTGNIYRFVLGSGLKSSLDLVKTKTTTTQRIYALKVAPDGTEMRAAYDLVASHLPDEMAPAYPERYARLDLVCGDAAAFPEFDGWTGRIAGSTGTSDTGSIYWYTLVGSAKDGSGDRAFHLRSEVPFREK